MQCCRHVFTNSPTLPLATFSYKQTVERYPVPGDCCCEDFSLKLHHVVAAGTTHTKIVEAPSLAMPWIVIAEMCAHVAMAIMNAILDQECNVHPHEGVYLKHVLGLQVLVVPGTAQSEPLAIVVTTVPTST